MEQNVLEAQLRRTLVSFVREAGIKLKLSPIGVATALMITHLLPKNIVLKTMKEVHILGEALVLIASKTTEELRKVRDVVNVTYRMLHPSPHPPIEIDQKYKSHKDNILNYEQIILRNIGFSLNFELPHKYMLNYLKSLGASQILIQTCWTILNDAFLHSPIALSDPILVAVSIIYFSIQVLINNESELNNNHKYDNHYYNNNINKSQYNNNNNNHNTSSARQNSEQPILRYLNQNKDIELDNWNEWWTVFEVSIESILKIVDLILSFFETFEDPMNIANKHSKRAGDWETFIPTEILNAYHF
jgi:hypothetical protein